MQHSRDEAGGSALAMITRTPTVPSPCLVIPTAPDPQMLMITHDYGLVFKGHRYPLPASPPPPIIRSL